MTEIKKVGWRSPSNIAIVKYWGKHGKQLPNNASISMTLNGCYSETRVEYAHADQPNMEFYFDGQKNEKFAGRIQKFLDSIKKDYPFLNNLKLTIHSKNSFPHSAGIASSASAMSALALCLVSIYRDVEKVSLSEEAFYQKASELARLASGSASRSVYGSWAAWGKHSEIEGSDDTFAVPVDVHENFKNWRDSVMIVYSGIKNFSSTIGHGMMSENPYSALRYQNAVVELANLSKAMKEGDVDTFIEICEREALTLHAMMMTSGKGYFEMKPASIAIMEAVRLFRQETGLPIAFTLDAGPNVHVLYPESVREKVLPWLKETLVPLCENQQWFDDAIGNGPEKIV